MTTAKEQGRHTAGQWPDAICSGQITHAKASNYDGFYLADASHGIPTFGAVTDDGVRLSNYPGQTEEIAAQLVHRWNNYYALLEALEGLVSELDTARQIMADAGSPDYFSPFETKIAAARTAISAARGKS